MISYCPTESDKAMTWISIFRLSEQKQKLVVYC